MRRFYFPKQDSAIYEELDDRRAGLDEILEVGKTGEGIYSIRSLIEFDLSSVSSSIVNGTISPSAEFDLKLFLARAVRMDLNQELLLSPVSQSWVEGQGYFYQEPYTETGGVSWNYRSSGSAWDASGSDIIEVSQSTVTVTEPIDDITVDITDLTRAWLSGSLPNYGLLLQFPTASEDDHDNEGRMYIFSKNTHTIYQPTLIAKWDDQTYSTGSLNSASISDLTVFPTNMKRVYHEDEVVRINITARDRAPLKTFDTQFTAWENQYLPTSSFYSVVDVHSREVIIPFDDYSKINVDSNGNYIKFHIEKMFPRRYYKLRFKVEQDGFEYIFDDDYIFRVE